jgi:hypothetical protein
MSTSKELLDLAEQHQLTPDQLLSVTLIIACYERTLDMVHRVGEPFECITTEHIIEDYLTNNEV